MGGSEVQSLYVEWKKAEVWGGVSSPEGPRTSFSRLCCNMRLVTTETRGSRGLGEDLAVGNAFESVTQTWIVVPSLCYS